MDMRRVVGENLKRERKAAGLTQEELATRSGFSFQYVNEIENGKRNPTIVAIYEIAQALGTTHIVLVTPMSERA